MVRAYSLVTQIFRAIARDFATMPRLELSELTKSNNPAFSWLCICLQRCLCHEIIIFNSLCFAQRRQTPVKASTNTKHIALIASSIQFGDRHLAQDAIEFV